jgi:hypothetical protein
MDDKEIRITVCKDCLYNMEDDHCMIYSQCHIDYIKKSCKKKVKHEI